MKQLRFELLSRYRHCIHGITEKEEKSACRFSLALHTGEPKEAIVANRKRFLKEAAGNTWHIVTANQTHGDRVGVIDKPITCGWREQATAIPDTDALITDRKHILLGILTADCVPILLYDPEKEVVGAVHAGWRGSAAHIVQKTVKTMTERFGSNPSFIVAGIGPAIGGCCYEVDENVAKHFENYPNSVIKIGEKYCIDLKDINKYQLLEAGLSPERIEVSDLCTACNNDRFFSYRKEGGCSGRFLSYIGMT